MNNRVWILGGALIVAACAGQKGGAGPQDVAVKVNQLFPRNTSLDASQIAVKLQLFNPRTGGVTIEKINYEIDTGDVSGIVKGSKDGGDTLESQQTAEVEFEQSIPLPKDRDAYQKVLAGGNIPVSVKGTVHFADGSSSDFERQGSVGTPSLPKFEVTDAQAARYGSEGLDVTFFLRVINENDFSVTIEQVEYAISINGKELKKEAGAIGTRLPSGAAQEFEVSVILDPKTFPEVKGILTEQKLDYTVAATVQVAGLEIPFEQSKGIELGSGEE
jgi:LEA14-like dessication related protein